MNLPRLDSIITSDLPGVFFAAALDSDQMPCRSFVSLWPDAKQPVRLGQTLPAIVRAYDATQGGYFLALETGETGFLGARDPKGYALGEHLSVKCKTEARRGKYARMEQVQDSEPVRSAYGDWLASLPVGDLPSQQDNKRVESVLEDAVATHIVLPQGGRLHLTPTPALTAIDIDTAGRTGRGSAGARALAINREAVCEAARLIGLRDLGGLFVVDLVGPLNARAGDLIRSAFLDYFGAISARKVTCLKPSRLGLMEISVERGARPLTDILLDADSVPDAEWAFIRLLGEAERALRAEAQRFFYLRLSKPSFAVYSERRAYVDTLIRERFSNRVEIVAATIGEKDGVIPK